MDYFPPHLPTLLLTSRYLLLVSHVCQPLCSPLLVSMFHVTLSLWHLILLCAHIIQRIFPSKKIFSKNMHLFLHGNIGRGRGRQVTDSELDWLEVIIVIYKLGGKCIFHHTHSNNSIDFIRGLTWTSIIKNFRIVFLCDLFQCPFRIFPLEAWPEVPQPQEAIIPTIHESLTVYYIIIKSATQDFTILRTIIRIMASLII